MDSNNVIFKHNTDGKKEFIVTYVKSDNGKKIILFRGDRQSFRCKQRGRMMDGQKCTPLRFVSYKETMKHIKRGNTEKVLGPLDFETVAKL